MGKPHSIVLSVIVVSFTVPVMAQNLESIGKEKPITLSGGMSLSQIFYGVHGIESRRDPYSYFASGNINISLYGWSVPFSFSVSNQNTAFQQPFNQYSIHPTYKSITGHFGYTSMSYSSYTVNGHLFLGGAVDVVPEGKWKFSALYGRFLKAVEPDTTSTNSNLPSFERMGYGFKVGYNTETDFVDVTLFHAEDQINSISYVPDSLNILPQENLVVSIGAGKSFFTNFLLKAEIASSAISADTRASETEVSHPLAEAKFLYTPRLSSSFYKAFKTSLDYQQDFFTVGVAYERIDPQYRTLGAYYFNSDLENITLNISTSILQGQMNIAASAGSQHDKDAGQYSVEVENQDGCKAFDTFILETSIDLLQAEFFMAAEAMVGDTIVMVDVSWPLPENIAWSYPASMEKIFDYGPVVYGKFNDEGVYEITLTAALGECRDKMVKTVTIMSTSEDLDGGRLGYKKFVKNFELYPNPNSGDFDVRIDLEEESPITLSVWNPTTSLNMGKWKDDGQSSYLKHVELRPLQPGTYVLRLDHAMGYESIRFIVH